MRPRGRLAKPGCKKDLTGKVYGKLTVVGMTDERKHSQILWKVVCTCGGERLSTVQSLRDGYNTTCGKCPRDPKYTDLSGERFGRLRIIRYVSSPVQKKHRRVLWECVCDCGVIKTYDAFRLNSGQVQSCGCYRRDKARAHALSRERIRGVFI